MKGRIHTLHIGQHSSIQGTLEQMVAIVKKSTPADHDTITRWIQAKLRKQALKGRRVR